MPDLETPDFGLEDDGRLEPMVVEFRARVNVSVEQPGGGRERTVPPGSCW
jgi:hypothetical protein